MIINSYIISDAFSNFTSAPDAASGFVVNPQFEHRMPLNVRFSASLPDFVRCCVHPRGHRRILAFFEGAACMYSV